MPFLLFFCLFPLENPYPHPAVGLQISAIPKKLPIYQMKEAINVR